MPPPRTYAVITPCKDEAEHARVTLDSVTSQTLPPTEWVIVDDGSTDDTGSILQEYVDRFDYIRVVRVQRDSARRVGPAVIEAFNAGYRTLDPRSFEFLCKLDLDLKLPPRYFETLIERMERNPQLGSCSGKVYYEDPRSGKLVSEKVSDEMAVGAAKFYRSSCFQQIGGFVSQVMWDGIDAHRCRMLGWQTESVDDPELQFIHLRPMGSSQTSIWAGRKRHGFGQYFMGTHPIYMLVSGLYRMTRPPLIVGGLGMLWGYASSFLRRVPRYPDLAFRRFLRRYQWSCLLMGKARATRRLDRLQKACWSPPTEQAPDSGPLQGHNSPTGTTEPA